jgi:multicomponent Na+:H+ antiporter subunit G
MIIAGIGIVRMPDLFLRMSAVTKAAKLGAGCTLVATALHFDEAGVTSRAVAAIIFLFVTAPVSAHMIARAAYANDVELWEGTAYDELAQTGVTKPEVDTLPDA